MNSENACTPTDPLPPPPEINVVHKPRKKNYPQCSDCGLHFKRERDLQKHMDADSWASYVAETFHNHFACDICVVFFKTSKAYMQHIGKEHMTESKDSSCPMCEKTFKSTHAVKFHVRQVHERATRRRCPICGKEFYNKYLIPAHREKCRMNT
jgi:uncharacterized C2H2 Zn-finger protein